MGFQEWLATLALLTASVAIVMTTITWRRLATFHPQAPQIVTTDRPLIAFVVNPTKSGVGELRLKIMSICASRYLPEPLWLETTVEDPGTGQARYALEQGAKVVAAVGGDGTVRAVAETLAGTGVPMGLVPLGTGNLLARNIDVPLDPLAAVQVILDGRDAAIDVGRLRVERWASDPGTSDHIFLVIAGMGFDGAMVADTDATLKAKVGWIAYFLAGIRNLNGRRPRVRAWVDNRPVQTAKVRSVLIGNCGRIPAGLTLLPGAEVDDGWLDLAAIDVRGGLAGWAQLFGEVVLQGAGLRHDLPVKAGTIVHTRAQRVRLEIHGSAIVQVDGEIVGDVASFSSWVEPGALIVKRP